VSQENVEVVRRANALLNAGDTEDAFALVHPDVEFRDLQNAPDLPEVMRGHESLRLVLRQWMDAYDEFGVEVYEYIDADPWVIADVRWHGKAKGSEMPVDVRQVDMCRFVDGKIVEWVVGYPDLRAALKAVGLEE